jgi:hypothetical protein
LRLEHLAPHRLISRGLHSQVGAAAGAAAAAAAAAPTAAEDDRHKSAVMVTHQGRQG